jgi:hypothetical protein
MRASRLVLPAIAVATVAMIFASTSEGGRRSRRCRSACCYTQYDNCCDTPANSCCCPNGENATTPPDNTGNTANNPPRVGGVHCLFIAGTADVGVAGPVTNGTNAMVRLFTETPGLKEKIRSRKTLSGADATPENILQSCDEIKSTKEDTIFVFYHGHGGTKDGQHVLLPLLKRGADDKLPDGLDRALPRAKILEALTKKEFRFICLVSDACSNKMQSSKSFAAGAAPSNVVPSVVSLMLDNKGILDVNSSTYDAAKDINEKAWVDNGGGLFTLAFVELGKGQVPDPDGNNQVSWKKEFLPALATKTDNAFQNFRKTPRALASDPEILSQDHQTVQLFPHDS